MENDKELIVKHKKKHMKYRGKVLDIEVFGYDPETVSAGEQLDEQELKQALCDEAYEARKRELKALSGK
jgi:hypothetical protein